MMGNFSLTVAQMSFYQSTLLLENGIREPLYVTVLRQLGFDTTRAQNLSQLDALDLSGLGIPDSVLRR